MAGSSPASASCWLPPPRRTARQRLRAACSWSTGSRPRRHSGSSGGALPAPSGSKPRRATRRRGGVGLGRGRRRGNSGPAMETGMEVRALTPVFGAEIVGLDISRPLEAATFGRIREIWLAHSLLLIREQTLDEAALVRFSRGFGRLEAPPASAERAWADGGSVQPEIWIISNVIENGKPIGGPGGREGGGATRPSHLAG